MIMNLTALHYLINITLLIIIIIITIIIIIIAIIIVTTIIIITIVIISIIMHSDSGPMLSAVGSLAAAEYPPGVPRHHL